MTPTLTPPRRANRLAHEQSPYLLQHRYNPVDWYSWGEEAFGKARAEGKPVFLSIGYSTCHWCHVMERESFENEEIAALLNADFISIKVDREERPDVDRIYMTFVQATTGQGGWPLSAFLTPDLRPFYGGTYFPPRAVHGRPGFADLLRHIAQLWKDRSSEIQRSAHDLHARLEEFAGQRPSGVEMLNPGLLDHAAKALKAEYDPTHGGFGGAPKFPRPSHPALLLQYGIRCHDEEAVRMVLHACERMAAGGIYDHLGGGFHRYAVDAEWLVPHFEKMLYDNAQLIELYLDAFLARGDARFADVVRDTLRYVLRDMTHPDGGFYSAEDADSEGKEGKFYCWTVAELRSLLSAEELDAVVRYFGVTAQGNFIDHSDPDPLPGQNVLSLREPRGASDQDPLFRSAKEKMAAARARRVRPLLDDKILASWNGMMLGAVARAAAVLGDNVLHEAAGRCLRFVQERLWDPESRTLYQRWRGGKRQEVQLLEAYANMLAGSIQFYEATLEPDSLEWALALADGMVQRFYDEVNGGFWQSPANRPDLILRLKEDYDGAEPSGNSVAILALFKLAAITGRPRYRECAEQSLRAKAERMRQVPQAVPHLLRALDFWLAEPRRLAVAGDPRSPGVVRLLAAAHGVYQPNKVVLGDRGPVESVSGATSRKGDAVAYPCSGTTCQAPTSDPEVIRAWLIRQADADRR